jgi:hypothetical protein
MQAPVQITLIREKIAAEDNFGEKHHTGKLILSL